MRPPLFIGSSREAVHIARALHANLEDCSQPSVWEHGIFPLTKTTLPALLEALDRFDFAALILSDDDTTEIRGEKVSTARDNVIFECGLFLGRIGPERTFLLVPRGVKDLHLPTDLAGVKTAEYDASRTDGDWRSALVPAADEIRSAIKRLARPFDAELCARFEDLSGRMRNLHIQSIVRSDRASEFPSESELERLDASELAALERLVHPNVIKPESLEMVRCQWSSIRDQLFRGRGGRFESAVLARALGEFERDIEGHELRQ